MAFEGLTGRLSAVFKGLKNKGKLNENDVKTVMREVRLALLEADVNFKVAKQFIADVTEACVGERVMESLTPAQQVIKIVDEKLTELMGGENAGLYIPSKPPGIILMCGLQGSGKTTHAAKLSHMLKGRGHRPLLVACDVYRPAAIDQLKVMGERAGAKVYDEGQGDPVQIAKNGLAYAKDYGHDVVIFDTAGRLHIDEGLMQELLSIKEVVQPHETLLVIDSMTGQDAVNAADAFNNAIEISGVILTKLDGDTRGGAAISVRAVTGRPIKFAGVGEKIEDLEVFYPDRMSSRILGMGDVLSFIEKAQQTFDEKETKELERKFNENKFDLNDMLVQLESINKMGSLDQILSMIPGGSKVKTTGNEQAGIKKTQAIIHSMTTKEREKPKVINPSRKRRIAAGSGTEVQDVNKLLKQFEQMQKMMKSFKKTKGRGFKIPGMPF